MDLDAVVDSGADLTTIPAGHLRALGVDVDALPVIGVAQTAGGLGQQRMGEAILSYTKKRFADRYLVAEKLHVTILGTGDFFHEFAVNFSGWLLDPPTFRIDPRQ